MQLARSLGEAFVVGALSAPTLFEIFSPARLQPFKQFVFYDQLGHLLIMVFRVAEQMTTPLTVQRLIEAQQDPASKYSLVRRFIVSTNMHAEHIIIQSNMHCKWTVPSDQPVVEDLL